MCTKEGNNVCRENSDLKLIDFCLHLQVTKNVWLHT